MIYRYTGKNLEYLMNSTVKLIIFDKVIQEMSIVKYRNKFRRNHHHLVERIVLVNEIKLFTMIQQNLDYQYPMRNLV